MSVPRGCGGHPPTDKAAAAAVAHGQVIGYDYMSSHGIAEVP